MKGCDRRHQRGATIIEFALVLLLFLTFFLGVVDFSRMLFTWNAANEASRSGARYATVCDDKSKSAEVLAKMQQLLPQIQQVDVQWSPSGCALDACEGVTVRITELEFQWISPVLGSTGIEKMLLPEFSTYLPREAMRQDDGASDQLCTTS